MMPLSKILQSFWHAGQDLDRMIGNGMSEAIDFLVQVRRERNDRQPLEGSCQRMSETVKAVAVSNDALPFDIIEDFANLLGTVFVMIEKGDEPADCPLEIDVVLPERVIGVDEQRLSSVCRW